MSVVDEMFSRYDESRFVQEKQTVLLYTTDQTEIQAKIWLDDSEDHRRLSDLLNDSRAFLPLTEAEFYVAGKLVAQYKFICVNKQLITYAIDPEAVSTEAVT